MQYLLNLKPHIGTRVEEISRTILSTTRHDKKEALTSSQMRSISYIPSMACEERHMKATSIGIFFEADFNTRTAIACSSDENKSKIQVTIYDMSQQLVGHFAPYLLKLAAMTARSKGSTSLSCLLDFVKEWSGSTKRNARNGASELRSISRTFIVPVAIPFRFGTSIHKCRDQF